LFFILLSGFVLSAQAQLVQSAAAKLDKYNVAWISQSNHSSGSMPCGGGDIGLNVWVEKW
jgi:Domain of unknown function (DUF5703)